MQYITAHQASLRWDLTVRRVQDLCKSGRIPGAVRWGRDWMIPRDARKPEDRRSRTSFSHSKGTYMLPKKNPAIVMTNLYETPGSCAGVLRTLSKHTEATTLFHAQMAYCQGDIQTALRLTNQLLEHPHYHDLQIGCGITLAMCAIYRGDVHMWKRAKTCIQTAPYHPEDVSLVEFWSAAMDSEISDTTAFPEWFSRGCFDPLPTDSYPAARYYYLKYLWVFCKEAAAGQSGTRDDQIRMQMFPMIAEPFISQSRIIGSLISEIYMRLVCAVAYHDLGMDDMAIQHLDLAISHALPDRLYMILAEYRHSLDFLLDARLSLRDPAAAMQVKTLSKQMHSGWTHLHNTVLGRRVSVQLTTREREVAKLASYGLSNKEIALRLNISINTVKQSLRNAMDKTGALRRSDLSHYL